MEVLEDHFVITSKLCELAAEIQTSSFALHRVSPSTARKLKQAWREAVQVMNQTPQRGWTKIVDGHLYGYHVPSRAKRLFRAFPFSSEQPWPDETFRRISQSVAKDLHDILVGCLTNLKAMNSVGNNMKFAENDNSPDQGGRYKRPRLDPLFKTCPESLTVNIDPTRCPLDYFLYHNEDPNAVNCSEHVDRGFLIAVSLTDVPGLEVLTKSRATNQEGSATWICPETRVYNSRLYKEAADSSMSDLVCIMSGGQLTEAFGANFSPCVHRVRKELRRARLSISYELRGGGPSLSSKYLK